MSSKNMYIIGAAVIAVVVLVAIWYSMQPAKSGNYPTTNYPRDSNIPPVVSDSPTGAVAPPLGANNLPSLGGSTLPPSGQTIPISAPTTSSAGPVGTVATSVPVPTPATKLPSITTYPLKNTVVIGTTVYVGTALVDGDYYLDGRILLGAIPVTGLSTNAAKTAIYPISSKYTTLKYTVGTVTTTPAVTAYTDANKGGKAMTTATSSPSLISPFLNSISSIIVPLGTCAVLYDGLNYTGNAIKIYGPSYVNDFGRIGFNDKTKSIKLIPTFGNAGAVIYADASSAGMFVSVGRLEVADVRSIGFPVNALSSMVIKAGYAVTLHNDLNFGGTPLTFAGVTNVGTLPNFNDKTKSIKISL